MNLGGGGFGISFGGKGRGGTSGPLISETIASLAAIGTNSVSFVDIPLMTVTLATTGRNVLLIFQGNWYSNGAEAVAGWRFMLDGVGITNSMQVQFCTLDDFATPAPTVITLVFLVRNLAAGNHTFKVQWCQIATGGQSLNLPEDSNAPYVFTATEI